jgi:hypothetical protein
LEKISRILADKKKRNRISLSGEGKKEIGFKKNPISFERISRSKILVPKLRLGNALARKAPALRICKNKTS